MWRVTVQAWYMPDHSSFNTALCSDILGDTLDRGIIQYIVYSFATSCGEKLCNYIVLPTKTVDKVHCVAKYIGILLTVVYYIILYSFATPFCGFRATTMP